MSNRPSMIKSILAEKCPNCRQGNMFLNRSVFPLRRMFQMPECCPVCRQRMELEPGFYYGSSYVSYGIGIVLAVLVLVVYGIFFGISIVDDSIYYSLGVAMLVLLVLMPWILRYSRVIYFYCFVSYGSNKHRCTAQ